MDLSVNKIHRILLDAGLPSTIEDLKNPTENYIVNLLKTFLSQFCIDISVIDQPLAEQYTIMLCPENSDIINLVNLHTAVSQIFDKIFINDFCITDITSPGQKRFRRQAKFLANFILYAMQKKLELNDKMENIQARSRRLEELKEKKAQVLESINKTALYKAKQLSLIKKLKSDIQRTQLEIGEIDRAELELEVKKADVEKKNQKAKELCGSAKTELENISKTVTELQLEVVHLPEEYRSRLHDLEEQKDLKVQERDVMQQAIQDKKQSVKQMEMKLKFIQKMNEELATLKTAYEQLKNQKMQWDNVKKEIDSLNNAWNEQQNKLAVHKDQMDTEINELRSYYEEHIAPLCNLHNQLLSEMKLKKVQLDASKVSFDEKCLERNKLLDDINKKEKEIEILIHNCQTAYDNEIMNELELRKDLGEE